METIAGAARLPPGVQAQAVGAADAAARLGLEKRLFRRKVEALKEKRREYETRWKAIRDYQLPHIGEFADTADRTDEARRRDLHIWNGTAWESNQAFAAGIMSGLTPQNRKWFRLSFSARELKDNTEVSRLLDQRMDILNDVLDKSNFYNAIHCVYLELAFGQAPLAIFQDREKGVRFVPVTIGTYYLEADADGEIGMFCREVDLTARQLADKFGVEALPENVRRELANHLPGIRARHKVYWLVERNRKAEQGRAGRQFMPYVSLYWLDEAKDSEWLYVGGFHEWPVPVARYLVTAGHAYGKGPGWFAEGDAKQLHILEKDKMTLTELTVKPPLQVDAQTDKAGINLIPGGVTVTGPGERSGVRPIFDVNPNVAGIQEVIGETEEHIKRLYSADLFRMLDAQEREMTAREVIERTQEKMQQLGPVVQRMQFEFLSRIIERVYNILDRAGVFPAPEDEALAEELATQEIKIEYISPLAQAQKMSGLVNIEQAIGFTGQLSQFDPSVLDKVDWARTVDEYFSLVGAPASIKRSGEEYEMVQREKAEQAAKMQQMQQAQAVAQMAAPAAQAAKNATEAANDGNPALQQLLGIGLPGAAMGGGMP